MNLFPIRLLHTVFCIKDAKIADISLSIAKCLQWLYRVSLQTADAFPVVASLLFARYYRVE